MTELAAIAPANNRTNACTFLCLVIAQKLFSASQKGRMNDDWLEMLPGLFQELILHNLVTFNTFREKRNYDAIECLAVLKKEGVLLDSTELVEKIVAKDAVFSPQGHENLLEGLVETDCLECDFWMVV